MDGAEPINSDGDVYAQIEDLELDPEGPGVLMAAHAALLPLALAGVLPCAAYVAPAAGAMFSAQASTRAGEIRFGGFQLLVIEFLLVVLLVVAQVVAAAASVPTGTARWAVAGAALVLSAIGFWRARSGRALRIPGLSPLVFRLGLKGQPRWKAPSSD